MTNLTSLSSSVLFNFNWIQKKSFNLLILLYFLLTLYSTFTQLVRKSKQICLLIYFAHWKFRNKIYLSLCSTRLLHFPGFAYTLGKIYFLLCFACLQFLCLELPKNGPKFFGRKLKRQIKISYNNHPRGIVRESNQFWKVFKTDQNDPKRPQNYPKTAQKFFRPKIQNMKKN